MSNWITHIESLSLVEQLAMGSFIVAVIGVILLVLFHSSKNRYYKRAKIRKYYSVVWKKSKSLKPREVLRIRGNKAQGYDPYYYERPVDISILEKIAAGENVIVVGAPLAGKTRTVYQVFKRLRNCEVIIPKDVNIDTEDFLTPRSFTPWRKKILFLDDLNKYTVFQNLSHLLNDFAAQKVVIVATCRSGPELEGVKKTLEQYFSSLFQHQVDVGKIERNKAEKIAREAEREMPKTFDGNVGSIFLPLDTMKDRYNNKCDEIQKCILRSIKRLYLAGIIEERETFSRDRVKRVCTENDKIDLRGYEWTKHFDQIQKFGLIVVESELIKTEETYIENIIEPEIDIFANLREMLAVFSNDPEALFKIGDRADDIGDVDINIASYKKIAIMAYKKALEFWTLDQSKENHAMTMTHLGIAYRSFSQVENKAENCRLAIKAFDEALKVYTPNRFPIQYAATLNNLGSAYQTLSEAVDKAKNCQLAIKAYDEALKLYALKRFRIQYSTTLNNLGNAYATLAEVGDKAENCRLAIKVFREALKVRTLVRFAEQYAMSQTNLGVAYRILSEVENKAENCRLAIIALSEALKVRTLERSPMAYAMTQNNLGIAYGALAEAEDKAENCRLAIIALSEALKVRTLERSPMAYAMTQNNLGTAYWTLAEEMNKRENCEKARIAFEEALKVYKKEDLTQDIEIVKGNLQRLQIFCGSD